MWARWMIWTGGISAGFAALCCVTGLLPFVLGALGLTSLIGVLYRDSVLFSILALSLVIMGVGLWLKKRSR
jgi:mercuric ion transport protein